MADIKESVVELIGNTPILKLNNYSKASGIENATLLAKLEYLNPAGSVKDRIALAMIEDAEKKRHSKAWSFYNRAYFWKHRNRACRCSRCKRIQGYFDFA